MGKRLREERVRLGFNQMDFGELAGVKKNAQINYESGKRSPDAAYLSAIATAGVDILYVLTGVPADPAWLADMPKRITVDTFRFRICLGLVAEEYRQAAIDLPQMAQGLEAVWLYNELVTRIVDPEDGDELEATLPLLRHLLRKRLSDVRSGGSAAP